MRLPGGVVELGKFGRGRSSGSRRLGGGSLHSKGRRLWPRRAIGATTSLIIHSLLLVTFLWQAKGEFQGAPGEQFGDGIQVAIVDGLALGASAPPRGIIMPSPILAMEEAPIALKPVATPKLIPISADVLLAPEEVTASQASLDQGAAPPTIDAIDNAGAVAAAHAGQTGASAEEAGGDPNAQDVLLAQIARCLPPDLRPRLGFARLVLTIGEGGVLRAAPYVTTAIPRLSPEETAATDRVVQAAIQCGPYVEPQFRNRVISIVPDFSVIRPTLANLGGLGGGSGGRAGAQ